MLKKIRLKAFDASKNQKRGSRDNNTQNNWD